MGYEGGSLRPCENAPVLIPRWQRTQREHLISHHSIWSRSASIYTICLNRNRQLQKLAPCPSILSHIPPHSISNQHDVDTGQRKNPITLTKTGAAQIQATCSLGIKCFSNSVWFEMTCSSAVKCDSGFQPSMTTKKQFI